MAEESTTDVRDYLIVSESVNEDGTISWLHLAKIEARNHEEALKIWALAHPEREAELPHFHVVTGSAIKGPLKGKPKPTYSLS